MKAILEDRTADGFCFRVDLNLRPEGLTGPLVIGLGAAEHYFLHYGRTWERAAWLKARPCAGDLPLGEELLERIDPFRFRRLLDFGTLEDIGAMRDRIAAAAENADRDIKRGPGGIRELEFLVQEMLREVNTLGSKTPDASVAHRVVEMKSCIDRLKEQAANLS